ncbi:MAG: hypothetical protein ABIA63_09295, partial [bacterium]
NVKEWVGKGRDALVSFVGYIIKNKDIIINWSKWIFGAIVVTKILTFTTALYGVTTALYGVVKALTALSLLKVTLGASAVASPVGLGILATLGIGGAIAIGIKGIKDHLDHINSLKFENVKILNESMGGGKKGILSGGAFDVQKANREAFIGDIERLKKEGKSLAEVLKNLKESFAPSEILSTYGTTFNTMVSAAEKIYMKPKPLPVTSQTGVSWTGGLSLGGESAYPSLTKPEFDPYKSIIPNVDAILKSQQAMMSFDKEVRKNINTPKQMSQGWISFGNTMSNVLANSVMQAGNAFENIVSSFKRMLTIMATELAAKAAFFGILNLISGGTVGTLKSFLGFRQHGGPVMAGSPYVVGERGPELFVPQQSGNIIPNQQNDNSTWNINFNGSQNTESDISLANRINRLKRDGHI